MLYQPLVINKAELYKKVEKGQTLPWTPTGGQRKT